MKMICLSAVLLLLAAGCGPRKGIGESSRKKVSDGLVVNVDNMTMDISWPTHRGKLISGYNIYISREPLAQKYRSASLPKTVKPFNRIPFPGDTEPEDGIEHYQAKGLENGVKYYVSVRVVYPDGKLSKPSPERLVVCGPRGEMSLSIRYQSNQDGYSFARDSYVRADAGDNDLMFYSKDGTDYLDSPVKLDGFLRNCRLAKIPFKGDFHEVNGKLESLDDLNFGERVTIKPEDWILLITPEKGHALINVIGITGEGENRKARLYFAYSELPGGELFF